MTASENITALLVSLGGAFLWLFVFYVWRDFRLDALREDLFELRDKLFLFAADGNIGFDHQAYIILRDRINTILRYAHHFTLSAFIAAMTYPSPLPKNPDTARWEELVNSIPSEEVRRQLHMYNTVMALTVFRHAVMRSFFLFIFFGTLKLAGLTWELRKRFAPQAKVVSAIGELESEITEADPDHIHRHKHAFAGA